MQLWDWMCWPHVSPVPSGAVGKDCQRWLLSRPRFVRAVAPRIFFSCSVRRGVLYLIVWKRLPVEWQLLLNVGIYQTIRCSIANDMLWTFNSQPCICVSWTDPGYWTALEGWHRRVGVTGWVAASSHVPRGVVTSWTARGESVMCRKRGHTGAPETLVLGEVPNCTENVSLRDVRLRIRRRRNQWTEQSDKLAASQEAYLVRGHAVRSSLIECAVLKTRVA
jgi:hypothetical protein